MELLLSVFRSILFHLARGFRSFWILRPFFSVSGSHILHGTGAKKMWHAIKDANVGEEYKYIHWSKCILLFNWIDVVSEMSLHGRTWNFSFIRIYAAGSSANFVSWREGISLGQKSSSYLVQPWTSHALKWYRTAATNARTSLGIKFANEPYAVYNRRTGRTVTIIRRIINVRCHRWRLVLTGLWIPE